MANKVYIEGVEDVMRCFDEGPKRLLKLSQGASRAGARAVVKHLKKGEGMSRWRRLVSAKVKKTREGMISSTMGLYNKEGLPAKEKIPDWFKAYWLNYGTLEGRDPSHTFQRKVRPLTSSVASRRKNKLGIAYRNFFEKSTEGWTDVFVEAYEKYLADQQEQLVKNK